MATEKTEENHTIPEKITLGGTEFIVKDHPELLSLVRESQQKTRKEEKDKLYKEVSDLKEQVKHLEPFKKQAEDAQSALEQFKTESESKLKAIEEEAKNNKEKQKMEGKNYTQEELDAKIAEAVNKVKEDAKADALKEVDSKYGEKFANLEKGLKEKVVADYRERLLTTHKDSIIPELLTGDTPEALDESLKTAIEKSKGYLTTEYKGKRVTLAEKESLEAAAKAEAEKKAAQPPLDPPKAPGKYTLPHDGESLLKNVKEMSSEEYAQNREAILREAKGYKE